MCTYRRCLSRCRLLARATVCPRSCASRNWHSCPKIWRLWGGLSPDTWSTSSLPSANFFHLFSFLRLPPAVKRRIKALKNYQVKQIQLEAKFYEEVHQLECKYAKLYEECYDKVSIDWAKSLCLIENVYLQCGLFWSVYSHRYCFCSFLTLFVLSMPSWTVPRHTSSFSRGSSFIYRFLIHIYWFALQLSLSCGASLVDRNEYSWLVYISIWL